MVSALEEAVDALLCFWDLVKKCLARSSEDVVTRSKEGTCTVDNWVMVVVVVEPLVYFTFLFFNETVITKTQGLVVAIAKREYINKSK